MTIFQQANQLLKYLQGKATSTVQQIQQHPIESAVSALSTYTNPAAAINWNSVANFGKPLVQRVIQPAIQKGVNNVSNFKIPTQDIPLAGNALSQIQRGLNPTQQPTFTPNNVYNNVSSIWQYPLRTMAQLQMSNPNSQLNSPAFNAGMKTPLGKTISNIAFGNEPLKSYTQRYQEGYQTPLGNVKGPASLPLFALGITGGLMPVTGGAKEKAVIEIKDIALNSKTYKEFETALKDVAPEIKGFIQTTIDSKNNAYNSLRDIYDAVKSKEPLPPIRTPIKTGSYSNLRTADNRLVNVTGEFPKPTLSSSELLGRRITPENLRAMKAEPLPWEQPGYAESMQTKFASPTKVGDVLATKQAEQTIGKSLPDQVFKDFINSDKGIDVKTKVGILDLVRTPDRVLQKIGLGEQAASIRKAFDTYQTQLPKELSIVTNWAKRVPANQNKELFQFLDGQINATSLTPETKQVATEIKSYLSTWADKLGLPTDNRISSYITHIFEPDFIKKEFDPEISSLIRDQVAGSVYDPFVQARLGKQGYVQDTWRALDAYLKRAVRKVNLDPALEQIKSASMNMEDSQYDYVKSYIDRVNMRPTKYENLLDNTIKQVIGYRAGQRPTIAISQGVRQMVYRGTLGLNPASALKNLTQGANTYARLGEKYTIIGYTNLLKGGLRAKQELRDVGVLKNDFVEDRTINATKKFWEKADRGLFSFFEGAEYINRGAVYFGSKAKALAKGLNEAQAIEIAKKDVRDTQFTFGSIDTPPILQGPINKTLLQFQSFNLKQAEFLTEMMKNKDYKGLLRFSLASSLMYFTIGEAIGMKPTDFVPFWGVASGQTKLGVTPPIKLAGDIKDTIFNSKGQYGQDLTLQDRLGTIGNDLVPFIPAGTQIKKTIQGLQAYQAGASQTPTGKTRFNVEQTPFNLARAALLGQYNLPGAQDYFNNIGKSKSEIIYNGLKDLKNPQEQAQRWNALVKDGTINKNNVSDVKQRFIDASLGLTDSEAKMRSLGVADGSRAQKIVDELNSQSTPQAKGALWNKYIKAKILTPQVANQVKLLLRKK